MTDSDSSFIQTFHVLVQIRFSPFAEPFLTDINSSSLEWAMMFLSISPIWSLLNLGKLFL